MTADIVLWLDLAEANQMEDDVVRSHIPAGAHVRRLSERGVGQFPEGTPPKWRPVLDAIDSMVRDARALERQSAGSRYWVTGRAGLPAFFHLGHRLSKVAAVTFVHQARNGEAAETIRLGAPSGDAGAVTTYFETTPRPIPRSEAPTPVALVVSSRHRPPAEQVQDAIAEQWGRVGNVVWAHSPADLDARTAPVAMRELEALVRETCDAYPRRSTLAVFIRGPSSLAFLVGAAIAPRVCRNVQVFQFEGDRYVRVHELPYPPVPDRGLALFFQSAPAGARPLRLDEEIRQVQLERSSGKVADRLEIVPLPAARPRDVPAQLRDRAPQILHFSGHGETGELLFQDDHGNPRPVQTEDLVDIIRLAGESVRLVVLSACYSESHAAPLLAHVDCVVAVRGPIADTDARHFATAFYRHLAEGDSVQEAFEAARLKMRLERPAGAAGGIGRDMLARRAAPPSADEEPVKLHERDEGCARSLVLVRRR